MSKEHDMDERSPTEILDEPIGDDLTAEIRDAGGGRSKVTVGLLVAVLMVLAFGAGIWLRSAVQSRPGPVTDDTTATVVSGTVTGSAGANTVTVTGQDGRERTVTLPPRDGVLVAGPGTPADLRTGAAVRVEGKPGADGGVAADRVIVTGH